MSLKIAKTLGVLALVFFVLAWVFANPWWFMGTAVCVFLMLLVEIWS